MNITEVILRESVATDCTYLNINVDETTNNLNWSHRYSLTQKLKVLGVKCDYINHIDRSDNTSTIGYKLNKEDVTFTEIELLKGLK